MPNAQALQEKWGPVLNHESMPEIKDPYRRAVTAILLENQERAVAEQQLAEDSGTGLLTEAVPATNLGADGFTTAGAAGRIGYDPILISLIRRAVPQLIAYDIIGVQPMSGPTGLVFFLKSTYVAQTDAGVNAPGDEALFDEAVTAHSASDDAANVAGTGDESATATPGSSDPFQTAYAPTPGMATTAAEALGGAAGDHFRQMSFTIDKTSVTAKSRALKAEYTTELAQDLKAIHGLDAEQELANILSTEILAEINREVIHTVNRVAVAGALNPGASGAAGVFNLNTDSDGRWSVEKYKGLHFQIEREANAIAIETRRGRGNIILGSADAIAALSLTGAIDTGDLSGGGQVSGDGITGNTFVGTINGQFKVYVDPYFVGENATEISRTASGAAAYANAATAQYLTVGYKGSSPYDAGLFYCPYVPLQMVKTIGQDTFQPKIGFKTRYGLLANPFADSGNAQGIASNNYYRTFQVTNL